MEKSSQKPVAIITGASAGIGDAIARKLANNGLNLVAVARRKERLDKLSEDLQGITEVTIVVGDVTDPATPKRAVEIAINTYGRLDCLINNAGSGKWMPVGDTDDQTLDEVVDISLKAPFRFAREALSVMQPGSCILNIGSVWGLASGMSGGAYPVVKAGLIGLTRTLAADYGPKGIRTNLVAPGVIRTEMTDAYWDTDYFQRTNQELTPFNRDGTVEDVAATVLFLATQAGSYINGETIALDGGWSNTKYLSPDALGR